jgi:transposase
MASSSYVLVSNRLIHLSTLDHQKIKQIKSMSASAAGIENLIREMQKMVNESFKEFNPKGLEQWIKDNCGHLMKIFAAVGVAFTNSFHYLLLVKDTTTAV